MVDYKYLSNISKKVFIKDNTTNYDYSTISLPDYKWAVDYDPPIFNFAYWLKCYGNNDNIISFIWDRLSVLHKELDKSRNNSEYHNKIQKEIAIHQWTLSLLQNV